MKKISRWGKNHKWAARFLIILSFILLTVAGIITGMLLDDLTISLPFIVLTFFIVFFLTGILFYPIKRKNRNFKPSFFYKKQKTFDFILAASTFFIVVCISNNQFREIQYFPTLHAAVSKPVLPSDSTVKTYKSLAAFSASLKDENGTMLKWKVRKALMKEQIKAIKKSNLSGGEKTALIILSIVLAIGLVILIAGLACNISCNGSEGAAILVGVGGMALVAFLLVLAIRGIMGKKRKKKIIEEEPSSST